MELFFELLFMLKASLIILFGIAAPFAVFIAVGVIVERAKMKKMLSSFHFEFDRTSECCYDGVIDPEKDEKGNISLNDSELVIRYLKDDGSEKMCWKIPRQKSKICFEGLASCAKIELDDSTSLYVYGGNKQVGLFQGFSYTMFMRSATKKQS